MRFFKIATASFLAVSLGSFSAARAGDIYPSAFTGDADDGIGWNYNQQGVVAVKFDSSSPVIANGVTFAPSGTNPGAVSGTINGVGYSLTGVDSTYSPNTNNGGVTGAGSQALTSSFFYSSAGGSASETISLTGLQPSTTYVFTEYTTGFGGPGDRFQTITDSLGGSASIDEDARGSGNGQLIRDVYTTGPSGTSVSLNFASQGVGSMHEYAFSNVPVTAVPSTGLASGGGLQTPGGVDANYQVTVSPDATYTGPNALVINGFPVAPNGPYVANSSFSQWISPDGVGANIAAGNYTYETHVTLPANMDAALATLSGSYASDNGLVNIIINGHSTGYSANQDFGQLNAFGAVGLGDFQPGVNTIDFIINNAGGGPNPSGFRAEGLYVVPEPSSCLLISLGAVGLIFAARRRRRAA